nr:MAG TPA: hypothetical protein [Caudoviricetes sp.]
MGPPRYVVVLQRFFDDRTYLSSKNEIFNIIKIW